MRQLKIGTSWVRGVVGDSLTPELIVDFACAFGTWCGGGPVVIGRDTRQSSTMLRAAVVSGLLSCGCEVVDLGVVTSPFASFAVRELGAAGGLSITGSHNTARWNALKFIGPDGALLNAVKSEELLDIYHASAFRTARWDEMRGVAAGGATVEALAARYVEHLLAALDVERIRARGFRVALDFCNGAGAPAAAAFLDALGCTLYPINEEPSGEFAHPPAPTPRNMRQLATLLRCLKADLGAAVNVDGDRVAFVTADGEALSEECTLPLAALSRLERRPGPIVTNLSTSRMVEEVARPFGAAVARTSVGEGYVMDRGLADGAVLAGEGNGGVAALPATTMFDALLTLGVVLEAMAHSGASLADYAARLPRYAMRKGEAPLPPDMVYRAVDSFRALYEERHPSSLDGVRVEWDDAWLHVRASNTEPLLRVIVEADTDARADALFDQAMAHARRLQVSSTQGVRHGA